MTRKEAITIIGNLEDKDIFYNPCDVQDAKTMAIKALEQEPTIGQLFSCEEVEELRKKIWKQVEQEPKTGHWIAVVDKWGDIVTTVNGYKCSECGEFNAYKDKYCPNCGAKMVEQESEVSE